MLTKRLNKVIKSEIDSLGYVFWGAELNRIVLNNTSANVLRIFIDSKDSKKNVSINDCQKVSRSVTIILDVEEKSISSCSVEVSSPGINRRIFNISQAKKFLYSFVKVKLISKRTTILGKIEKICESNVTLVIDKKIITFSFNDVDKMYLEKKIFISKVISK